MIRKKQNNRKKQKEENDNSERFLSLNGKRNLFWFFLALSGGSIIGGYFFPAVFIVSGLSLIGMGATHYSIDEELTVKISNMKPHISLEELVDESFPSNDVTESNSLVNKNDKTHGKHRSKIADDVWRQQILFSDASKKSALSPQVNTDTKQSLVTDSSKTISSHIESHASLTSLHLNINQNDAHNQQSRVTTHL